MVGLGKLKLFKIGELAKAAGVSRRTIDYYTNLGLLEPSPVECKKYRYYSDESLVRLRLIEELKKRRLTLEEIKKRFISLESGLGASGQKQEGSPINSIDLLRSQIRVLEDKLDQLKPLVAEPDSNDAVLLSKQILYQGMTFLQALVVVLSEIEPLL